jgi:hypothetical protein
VEYQWLRVDVASSRVEGRIASVRVLLAIHIFGAIAPCSLGEDHPPAKDDWMSKPLSSQFAEFGRFTVTPHPDEKDLVACHAEREFRWWGKLRVFKHQGDKIEWVAEFPHDYDEWRGHYVVDYRWVTLDATGNKVLESFESTHMGNGSLFLLELEGKEFRVILHAPARGLCRDNDPELGIPPQGEARFLGEHLDVEYIRAPGEPFGSVELNGRVSITDIAGVEVAVKPYSRIYRWDPNRRIFRAPESPPIPVAPKDEKK